ncbi:MAG: HD domain-containing phosphohydrolase [Desulfococcaceae bacterium]|jgi:putative nucleotidyltransferase with HDIG domain|nr:HD domain-containing phosphohydrolase [Desulfococcaceae bacterium]
MKILIADDDLTVPKVLVRLLKPYNFHCLVAKDGQEAWDIWQREKPRIVVTDLMMPLVNGLELCEKIRNHAAEDYTYVVMLSGKNESRDIVRGLEGGIDDYITKPVRLKEFEARIAIGARIVNLETELRKKYKDIKENYFQTIRMFNNLIEIFENDLGGHCRRVGETALNIARRHPDVSPDDYEIIETAGLFHDIGMIGLPAEVLLKSRRMRTNEESAMYRSHSELGEMILREISFLEPVARIVRFHHEQYNGRGFPDGLAGEDIPLFSRIISVASAYDNIIFRGKIKGDKVFQKMQMMSGYQLDPFIVNIMLEIHNENIAKNAKKNHAEISINDLEDGMILAEDIRRNSGALIMPAGTKLRFSGIDKLKKHLGLGSVPDTVLVEKISVN